MPENNVSTLLAATALLDFNSEHIASLVASKGWKDLAEDERVNAVYDYIRNDILFGYNRDDAIPASEVLQDGYGQCNTKGILFMALLRSLQIPCRFHGFAIHKELQRGLIPELFYPLAPDKIVHSWVEIVGKDNASRKLEGFILDDAYLSTLKAAFLDKKAFCGYGVGTQDLHHAEVEPCHRDTYIQKEGIEEDYQTYDSPDAFFAEYRQPLNPFKGFIYRHVVRHLMNSRVDRIRQGAEIPDPAFLHNHPSS